MNDKKIDYAMKNLSNSLERLGSNESNRLAVDGTMQRFEFSIELFWKALKRLLGQKGIEAFSPKDSLKKAYANKWIDDESLWIAMLYQFAIKTPMKYSL